MRHTLCGVWFTQFVVILIITDEEDSTYKRPIASTDKTANNFGMVFFIILQSS